MSDTLDKKTEKTSDMAVEQKLLQIETLINRELFEEAAGIYNAHGTDEQSVLFAINHKLFQLNRGDVGVDEAIWHFEDVVKNTAAEALENHVWAKVYGGLIDCYAQKRCPSKCDFWQQAALEAIGENGDVYCIVGKRYMAFDEREKAKHYFEKALKIDPNHFSAAQALAQYYYVSGCFHACEARLNQVPKRSPKWRSAQRLWAALHNAAGDFEKEQQRWEALLEVSWPGDLGPSDRISLAFSLAAQNKYSEALAQFKMVRTRDAEGNNGKYAQSRIEYLESATEEAGRQQLTAFPTISQKRNYCGPAVLELCLRYLDFDLNQDEIAAVVKREQGTPMYAIMAYLNENNIEARRIEATVERLRAAIDLGLPVIVEEEYSQTSHVAVITGYDERLGVFISNDPATHRQTIKTSRWMEQAGTLFGNGGIIVLGRRDTDLAAINGHCDDRDLKTAEHLLIMDDCARQRAGVARDGEPQTEQDAVVAETLRLASRALDLNIQYKLAWYNLASSWVSAWAIESSEQNEYNAQRAVYKVRTYFPFDEWPHQIQGRWLHVRKLYEESFLSYFEAHRADPSDGNNLFNMGECKLQCGELKSAHKYLMSSLVHDPSSIWTGVFLSVLYLKQLSETATGKDDDGETEEDVATDLSDPSSLTDYLCTDPSFAHFPSLVEREVSEAVTLGKEELLRRASHFIEIALLEKPENAWILKLAGELALRRGELEEGLAKFKLAFQLGDKSLGTAIGLSGCLAAAGKPAKGLDELIKVERQLNDEESYWATRAHLCKVCEDEKGAVDIYKKGIDECTGDREILTEALFNLLKKMYSSEAAGAQLRELVEARSYDEKLIHNVAWLLDKNSQRGHAIALFKMAVELFPSDLGIVFRLGKMLSENISTREEGIALLERAMSLAPEHPAPRIRLALCRLESEPENGLAILEPLLEEQDMFIEETRSCLLAQMGEVEASQQAHEIALRYGGDPDESRVRVINWHLDGQRYQRAVSLAANIDMSKISQEDKEWARDVWLMAHRLSGRTKDIMPMVEDLCTPKVPGYLAWEVYWAYRNINYDLAAKAALAFADNCNDNPEDAADWRVKAAGQFARAGDRTLLDSLADTVTDFAEARSSLVYAFDGIKERERAIAEAKGLYDKFPTEKCALEAMEHVCGIQGDTERQLGFARKLLDLYPYEHQGPERTSWILAKLGQVEEALQLSLKAVDAAPYCHLSHTCRAVSLFMADRFDEALVHARQSELIDPSAVTDVDNDALLVCHALTGNEQALQECLTERFLLIPKGSFPLYEEKLQAVVKQVRQSSL